MQQGCKGEPDDEGDGAHLAIGHEMACGPEQHGNRHGIAERVPPRAAGKEDADEDEGDQREEEIRVPAPLRRHIEIAAAGVPHRPDASRKQHERGDAVDGAIGLAEGALRRRLGARNRRDDVNGSEEDEEDDKEEHQTTGTCKT